MAENVIQVPMMVNLDEPLEVEHNQTDLSQEDTFELMKTYLDKKFKSVKRELSDSISKQSKKAKPSHQKSVFKYKSNEKQFAFNNEIIETVEEVMADLDSSRLRKELKSVTTKLTDRNKLIKMADRSPAGWATVEEYLSDELASDSEDEKRIRSAEARAIRKRTMKKSDHISTSSTITSAPGRPPSGRPSLQGQKIYSPFYSQQNNRGSRPENQQRRNMCFGCGQVGHWRIACPNLKPQSFGNARYPEQQ